MPRNSNERSISSPVSAPAPRRRRAHGELRDAGVGGGLGAAAAVEVEPHRHRRGARPLAHDEARAVRQPHLGRRPVDGRRSDRREARRQGVDRLGGRRRRDRRLHLGVGRCAVERRRAVGRVVVERQPVVREEAPRRGAHLVGGDPVELRQAVAERAIALAGFGLGERLRLSDGVLETEDDLRAQRVLGQRQLVGGRPVRLEALDLGQQPAVDLGAPGFVERRLRDEQADVVELIVEHGRGRRGVRADDVAEEARRAAGAEDLRRQVERQLGVAADPLRMPAEDRVALLQVSGRAAVAELRLRRLRRSALLVEAPGGEGAEGRRDGLLDVGRPHVAGDREDHVLRQVEGAEELQQVLALDVAQHLVRADPPALDPVLGERDRDHALERERRRVVELAVRLLDDDLGLALELAGVEERIGDRVGHDLEGAVEALGRHDEEVVGRVVDRAGVGVAADRGELLRDLLGARELLRALEEHVLEEVRHPGDLVRLVEVARLHPGVDRHHPGPRLLADEKGQAVGQSRPLHRGEKSVERSGRRLLSGDRGRQGERQPEHSRANPSQVVESHSGVLACPARSRDWSRILLRRPG